MAACYRDATGITHQETEHSKSLRNTHISKCGVEFRSMEQAWPNNELRPPYWAWGHAGPTCLTCAGDIPNIVGSDGVVHQDLYFRVPERTYARPRTSGVSTCGLNFVFSAKTNITPLWNDEQWGEHVREQITCIVCLVNV